MILNRIGSAEDLPDRPDALSDIDIPDVLTESVNRHRENLALLYKNLGKIGMDEAQVEASLTAVIDSYRRELLSALRCLRDNEKG